MVDIILELKNPDDKQAYQSFKELKAKSLESDELYGMFDAFAALTEDKSSYVRTRGFCLCCAQAKWDREGKLESFITSYTEKLNCEKPTAVRQCLKAISEAISFRPELGEFAVWVVEKINCDNFGDSMLPLIIKDIEKIRKQAAEVII